MKNNLVGLEIAKQNKEIREFVFFINMLFVIGTDENCQLWIFPSLPPLELRVVISLTKFAQAAYAVLNIVDFLIPRCLVPSHVKQYLEPSIINQNNMLFEMTMSIKVRRVKRDTDNAILEGPGSSLAGVIITLNKYQYIDFYSKFYSVEVLIPFCQISPV